MQSPTRVSRQDTSFCQLAGDGAPLDAAELGLMTLTLVTIKEGVEYSVGITFLYDFHLLKSCDSWLTLAQGRK